MNKELSYEKISDVCDINPYSVNDDSFDEKNIKYITISDMNAGYYDEKEEIDIEDSPSRAKRVIKEGCSVVSTVGVENRYYFYAESTPDNLVCTTGTVVFKPTNRDELLPEYLYYCVTSSNFYAELEKRETGTTIPSVNLSEIKSIKIPVPSIEKQKQLSELLRDIDNKIRLNRELSELLEDTAQKIYKSWFEEYEPYELEDDKNIPDKFTEKKLGDILSLEYGSNLPKKERIDGEYPVYGSNGINGSHNSYEVEGPNIIVGRKGTIGTVNLSFDNFWPIDTTYYVDEIEDYELYYIKHLLESLNLTELNEDSAVPGLNRNTAYQQNIIYPDEESIKKYNNIVSEFYSKKKIIKEENKNNKNLLDYLSPLLLNGDIHIEENEDEIKAP